MRPLAVLAAVCALATTAYADSPKLAEARKAIDEVRFDDAQRLLVGALADGGNSPAAVREIYKLSASTAVVLGQRENGEQYFRRWLVLDATATIGADVAPKLRAPFEAAQTYVAAHGRFSATTTRLSPYVLDVAVIDPLAMASSATIVGSTPVALSTERRARLQPMDAGSVVVAILDDRGNRLLELSANPAPDDQIVGKVDPADDPYAPDPSKPLPPAPSHEEPETTRRSRVWLGFAAVSAVFLVSGSGLVYYASLRDAELDEELEDRLTSLYYADVRDRDRTTLGITAIGVILTSVGAVVALPAVYLWRRSRKTEAVVVPTVSGDAAGASIIGRF